MKNYFTFTEIILLNKLVPQYLKINLLWKILKIFCKVIITLLILFLSIYIIIMLGISIKKLI